MVKEILFVETKDCAGCPAAVYDELEKVSMCQAKKLRRIPDHFSKPYWCPLIPEPERMPKLENVGKQPKIFRRGIEFGWNRCIDAIEGNMDQREQYALVYGHYPQEEGDK